MQADGCTYAWDVHTIRKRPKKTLSAHLWLNLRALNKQDMKVKEELSTEEVPHLGIQIPSVKTDRFSVLVYQRLTMKLIKSKTSVDFIGLIQKTH